VPTQAVGRLGTVGAASAFSHHTALSRVPSPTPKVGTGLGQVVGCPVRWARLHTGVATKSLGGSAHLAVADLPSRPF
jgi:hypothetical protein